jgi:regulatory protein
MGRRSSRPKERVLDEAGAREKCLRLLAVRARSTAELRERLVREGLERGVVSRLLTGLEEAGLVDDEEFARSWIASRQAAGIGRRRLAAELSRKGIARSDIERLIAEQVDDEMERRQAESVARRRLAGVQREAKALARVRRLLLGRGYGFGMVDDVLRGIAGEQGDLGPR